MRVSRGYAVLAIIGLTGSLLTVSLTVAQPAPAQAAVPSDFSAGNLISDANFFDGSAMSASDVQSFLNGKVSSCASGYTCLKNYAQATPTRAAVAGRCAAYSGSASESAASIIARVGAACNISQKALLVLLEKEQSLVTSSSPGAGAYQSATGYGCPDTAACNSTYYGFFNQVYAAAYQFEVYATTPTSWSHIAGRNNYIAFNPNASCGGSEVFIQNQATAGLYNYTPYQPNAAALANLYGTGDSCSAYGNRNFWRLYSDWFGSPTGVSSLARTTANTKVYVLSGTTKYAVPNEELLTSLAPLGAVSYVSQTYLDGFTTGPTAGRIIRGPDGSIYFFDSGLKLPFATCDMVVNYGGSCTSTGYMQLTAAQVAGFQTGPGIGQVLGTVEGARYYISAGTKREILDNQSQTAAGIPLGNNVLTENAVAYLPLGAPIVRDSVFAGIRGTTSYSFLANSTSSPVTASAQTSVGLPARSAGSLWPASIALIPVSGEQFSGLVTAPGSTTVNVLAGNVRYSLTGVTTTSKAAVTVSQAFIDSYPLSGTVAAGSFIKSASNTTVYVVTASGIRPISSWDALISLAPAGATPTIVTVPDVLISALPLGAVALSAGTLVRTQSDPKIYLVDGLADRVPVSSFDMTDEAGIGGYSVVSDSSLSAYTLATTPLGYGITCGTTNYVSADGAIHPLSAETATLFPIVFTPLSALTCAQLKVGSAAGQFVRTPNGAIYQLVGGSKLQVSSMARFAQLGGTNWLSISTGFASLFPTGPWA